MLDCKENDLVLESKKKRIHWDSLEKEEIVVNVVIALSVDIDESHGISVEERIGGVEA